MRPRTIAETRGARARELLLLEHDNGGFPQEATGVDPCAELARPHERLTLLKRLCWGDGLATTPTLASPETRVSCGSPLPCSFPIKLEVFCMPGPSAGCRANLLYAPPARAGEQPVCAQCREPGGAGTVLVLQVLVPPKVERYPIACPPHASSGEQRVLARSVDDKAMFRFAGTDDMMNVLSIVEVDRDLFFKWITAR